MSLEKYLTVFTQQIPHKNEGKKIVFRKRAGVATPQPPL